MPLSSPSPPAGPGATASFSLRWRSFVGLAVLVVLMLVARRAPGAPALVQHLAAWRHAPLAPLLFLALGAAYSAAGLPRQALCLAAGVVFGIVEGMALATVATGGGTMLGFLWIRRLGGPALRGRIRQRFTGRLEPVGRALGQSPFLAVLVLRLMPLGSALLVTAAAALVDVPATPFALATVLGALPQNLVFVLIGGGAQIGHGGQVAMGIALFALSTVLGVMLMRHATRTDAALGSAVIADTAAAEE